MWIVYGPDHMNLNFKNTDEHHIGTFYINTSTNVVRLDLNSGIAFESLVFTHMILLFSKKIRLIRNDDIIEFQVLQFKDHATIYCCGLVAIENIDYYKEVQQLLQSRSK